MTPERESKYSKLIKVFAFLVLLGLIIFHVVNFLTLRAKILIFSI
jgi:hypothetical protein